MAIEVVQKVKVVRQGEYTKDPISALNDDKPYLNPAEEPKRHIQSDEIEAAINAGEAAASHIADNANPHNTTAAQVGAVSITGDTMTGELEFSGTDHYGIIVNGLTTAERDSLIPLGGEIIFNTTTNQVQIYNGSSWVAVGTGGAGSVDVNAITTTTGGAGEYLNVAGGGGLQYRTPLQVLADIGAVDDTGDSMSGELSFTGTTHFGVKLNALTTIQRDGLVPVGGEIIYNTTTTQVEAYDGASWEPLKGGTVNDVDDLTTTTGSVGEYLAVSGGGGLEYKTTAQVLSDIGALPLSGGTLTGLLDFSGTGHGGLKLNNLTTAERDALTPTPGYVIFNTTLSRAQYYNGSAWVTVTNDHTELNNIGSNTHAQIDSHIASTSNPHSVTAAQAGAVDINGDTMLGDLSLGANDLNGVNAIQFELAPTHTPSEGSVYWNPDDKTLNIDTEVSGTSIQVGQEVVLRARNVTGSLISNGSVVYVNGASGQRPTIALADADSEATSHSTIGIVTSDIAHNGTGYVTVFGLVRELNTLGIAEGSAIYLSQTAGEFTGTPPSSPAHEVRLGFVVYEHATEGKVLVEVETGFDLEELHDVSITTPSDGQVLTYDSGTGLWQNETLPIETATFSDADFEVVDNADPTRIIKLEAGSITTANTRTLTMADEDVDLQVLQDHYDATNNPHGVTAAQAGAVALTGDTMTGELNFSGTSHYGIELLSLTTGQRDALTPAAGNAIFNSTNSVIQMYDGTKWIDLEVLDVDNLATSTGVAGEYVRVAIAGGLEYRTTSEVLSDIGALGLTGGTLSGGLDFSGTGHTGITLISLTTTQRDLLSPTNGALIYNTTENKVQAYVGGAWANLDTGSTVDVSSLTTSTGSAGEYVRVAVGGGLEYRTTSQVLNDIGSMPTTGGTFTGAITFSGTTHEGITLNSLTTAQRDALTPTGAELIFNNTKGIVEYYTGAAWVELNSLDVDNILTTSGLSGEYVRVAGAGGLEYRTTAEVLSDIGALSTTGGTLTGQLSFSGTGHYGLVVNNLTTAQRDGLVPAGGEIIYNTTTSEVQIYDGSTWIAVVNNANPDVNDLTTSTGTPNDYLRVAAGGGLEYRTTSQVLTDIGALSTTGGTLSGLLQFSGTSHSGLRLNSLTLAERDLLTPSAGDIIFNTTSSEVQYYTGAAWSTVKEPDVADLTTSGGSAGEYVRVAGAGGLEYRTTSQVLTDIGALPLTGGTLSGKIDFSGNNHAGLQLISLTTTERNALTPVAGDYIFNETDLQAQYYDGAAWIPATNDHTELANIGSNTHDQIDAHIINTSNPHSTSIANIGSGTLAQLNTAVTDATLDDSSSARTPTAHAATHTNGTDDIQDATAIQKGLMTTAYASKLDNVEANADVTDEANVTAAHPLVDETTLVYKTGDSSANMRIDVNTVTTATTRVLTMPDQDIDLTPGTGSFATAAEGDLAASALQNIVEDTTPQLGGQLDVNGNAIGNGTEELITFTETPSAVNQINVTNAALGGSPSIIAAGDDANIDLTLDGKGAGDVVISGSNLDITGNIVVSGTVDGRDVALDGTNQDNHIASTSNPHSTSIANIGSGTLAQLNAAVTDATLDDSSSARTPTAHASTHTNGTDDIQDATAAQKGLMTIAYASKLDGIEAGADVTDTANVDAAGAVMETDLIATSTGVPDAGKPIKLDASGLIDTSMYVDNDTTDHTALSNIGSNTHAQIDSHISSTSNPHSVTAAQAGAVALTGDTMTGLLQFSGTGHYGIKVNSLTTAQRDLLTPAAGHLIFNSTLGHMQVYDGVGWVTVSNDAGDITSGTLAHERGGLEADVSAFSGIVKITGGATSAVTITTFGESLIDDADASAARTTLLAHGGSVGTTDNRLVRSDGTGGYTLQEAGVTVDDSGNLTSDGNITAGGSFTLADGRTVQAGPIDSGGSGFRVLRVANSA